MRRLLAYILLVSPGVLTAQELEIRKIEIDAEKVYFTYDLSDSTRDRVYTVNLYASNDNFITPLKNVMGEIGLEVRPGSKKLLVLNAREELGPDFDGSVSFELRAKVYVPFIRMESFSENTTFVRGKPYDIYWRGGRPQNVLSFQLFDDNALVHTFSNIANEGKYTMILPLGTKPGDNYWFKISDSRNKDEVVNSTRFSVRRQVPLVYKLLPVALVGVGLYFLLDEGDDCKDCLPEFPSAPK